MKPPSVTLLIISLLFIAAGAFPVQRPCRARSRPARVIQRRQGRLPHLRRWTERVDSAHARRPRTV
jgi:hypothetical protein